MEAAQTVGHDLPRTGAVRHLEHLADIGQVGGVGSQSVTELTHTFRVLSQREQVDHVDVFDGAAWELDANVRSGQVADSRCAHAVDTIIC